MVNDLYTKAYLNLINESKNRHIIKYREIANTIGGEYIVETNTIDCRGERICFQNEWLLDNGSIGFNLINTNEDWSDMFYGCTKLTHLPNGFIIPPHVTCTEGMFMRCINLKFLPDNFLIPNNVYNCAYMFYWCFNLGKLPNNFTIPNNVDYCGHMFERCTSLTQLPKRI